MKYSNVNEITNDLVISWEVKDDQLNKSETLNFNHSLHSLKRANQRNIDSQIISVVIEYGTEFFKQGMIFYVLGENDLPANSYYFERKKFRNLVVVVSGDSNTIITCYRSKNPFKHIKKKQKNIAKAYYRAA